MADRLSSRDSRRMESASTPSLRMTSSAASTMSFSVRLGALPRLRTAGGPDCASVGIVNSFTGGRFSAQVVAFSGNRVVPDVTGTRRDVAGHASGSRSPTPISPQDPEHRDNITP
jgi:hypothetical protein